MVFIHLEGRKILRGSQDFSDKFLGRKPKKFENPWVKGNSLLNSKFLLQNEIRIQYLKLNLM
jgi:hypothetical protein